MNDVYWERNQLVLFLTKIWPSWIGIDENAESPEWSRIVFVQSPAGQLSWHVHTDEIKQYLGHLVTATGSVWDGHSTEEKYDRLRSLSGTG